MSDARIEWHPRKGRGRKKRGPRPPNYCPLCNDPNAGTAFIVYPWPASRADDDKVKSCRKCAKPENIDRLLAAKAASLQRRKP